MINVKRKAKIGKNLFVEVTYIIASKVKMEHSECGNCEHCIFVETLEPSSVLHYEIHVTVDYHPDFVSISNYIGVKPIVIDLDGKAPIQQMCSHTLINSDDITAYETAGHIADGYKSYGLTISRVKIETVPWHPLANAPTKEQYFEAHFAVDPEVVGQDWMVSLAYIWCLRKSSNLMKTGEQTVQMYTFRQYDTNPHRFQQLVNSIKRQIGSSLMKETIVEFALYDSNTSLDKGWI
jgi:hypothetical protein